MSGISIAVKAGADQASSSVSASGSIQHVITDQEVAAFGIKDAALKAAVAKYFGRAPNDAFLHSPTPWNDLYATYGWPQVQTILVLQSATVTGISSNPEVIASNKFFNHSKVAGTFNASVTTQVSNTESTTWSESSTLSFSESVNWKVGFEGLGEAGRLSDVGVLSDVWEERHPDPDSHCWINRGCCRHAPTWRVSSSQSKHVAWDDEYSDRL